MIPASTESYVLRSIIKKLLGHARTRTAPVDKMVADEYAISLSVCCNVGLVYAAIRHAVMRVCLTPLSGPYVPGVYVVAESLLLTAAQVWFFRLKSRVIPVLIECHRLRDTHRVHDMPFAFARFRSGPHNPVTDLSDSPDAGFASRERADAEERIRSEAVVSRHDVRVQSHVPQPYRLIGRGSRSSPVGRCHSLVLPNIASTMPSLCQPRTSSAYFSSASGTSQSFAPRA